MSKYTISCDHIHYIMEHYYAKKKKYTAKHYIISKYTILCQNTLYHAVADSVGSMKPHGSGRKTGRDKKQIRDIYTIYAHV